MGLFDLFKGGDGGLKKHAGRAANKRAQAQDRWQSLQALGAMKSPEAVEALLERFTYRVDPSITDQEEKELAMAGVVGAGDAAELPLRRFLAKSESVAWPVKMLEAIAGADTVVETLVGLLADMDTEYERDPQKKIDTLGQLEDRRDGRIVPAVLPFFEDMNEAARFHAVAAALVQDEPTGDEAEPLRARFFGSPSTSSSAGGMSFGRPRKNTTETRNVMPSMMKDVSTPRSCVAPPPSAAPTASITDHVPPLIAFAAEMSFGATIIGIVALFVGKTIPEKSIMSTVNVTSHRRFWARCATISPTTHNARAMSETIRIFLRSKRSMIGPAIGVTNAAGSVFATITAATACALSEMLWTAV